MIVKRHKIILQAVNVYKYCRLWDMSVTKHGNLILICLLLKSIVFACQKNTK